MAKKLIVVLSLCFVATLVGCWWFAEHGAADEGEGYTLVPVEYGRAADAINATGVVQPRDVYVVGSELAGRVVEVRADYNQEVAEGDLLARLDDTGIQTAEYSEVLEWDPDVRPPSADDEASYPRVVIAGAPPKRSFFTPPKIKL